MSNWKISAEPEGNNPGRVAQAAATVAGKDQQGNTGGLVIYLVSGAQKQEVSRVGFIRRNTKNPKVSFEKQLQAELDKARKAVEQLDKLMGDGSLQ